MPDAALPRRSMLRLYASLPSTFLARTGNSGVNTLGCVTFLPCSQITSIGGLMNYRLILLLGFFASNMGT
ncbi:MAG: hypothetical protein DMG61_24400, partial [Acidobacteria bacterium]